jgi:hypothetical protein
MTMLSTLGHTWQQPTSLGRYRRASTVEWAWVLAVNLVAAGFAGVLMLGGATPAVIAWLLLLAGIIAILLEPRYGIYLAVPLALAGDGMLVPWYPFGKNLSSAESLLFVHSAAIVSPLEIYLVATSLSWFIRETLRRTFRASLGRLTRCAWAFLAFVAFGVGFGLARGGNLNIALWEARPIFYLPLMALLASNLIQTREQASIAVWLGVAGLAVEGLIGSWHTIVELGFDLSQVDRIAEHSLSQHANTVFVLAIASWLYSASWWKRVLLPLLSAPIALTYLANQRRASFLTLAIGLVAVALALLKQRPRMFGWLMPTMVVLGILYLGAFWNSEGTLGMPARAVKSVLSDEASAGDQLSNLYREIENVNNIYTIRNATLLGVGFGRKFLILVPMPDISFFVWWEYIVHNSIVWIWMKTGIGGFLALLYLIGTSLMEGAEAIWRIRDPDLAAIVLTATAYVAMHFMYAYVDMSWDTQSMLFLGFMLGLLDCAPRLDALPNVPQEPRWPWMKKAGAASIAAREKQDI